jgi:hypothetical protein
MEVALPQDDSLTAALPCRLSTTSRNPADAKWWSKAKAALIFFRFMMAKLVASTAEFVEAAAK